ncbi:MAG TPA: glycosyltransferase family 9 protein [Vicinamibacterales bacterium]|nr:glycosyltransferase family 9 protein [Vicinamibacterales bacterium]
MKWPVASVRPWQRAQPPARVLAIRLHALGDIAITLPYLHAFHELYGSPAIDFLTRTEYAPLPGSLTIVHDVFDFDGGRRFKGQFMAALALAPRLIRRRYDVVLDLQNNEISRTIRSLVRPLAWSTFEARPTGHAAERTRRAIESAGFPLPRVSATMDLRSRDAGIDILRQAGWSAERELVVLSPSGAFVTRNWPTEHYGKFARLWAIRRPTQFVVLGTRQIVEKAAALQDAVGSGLLNLAGKTTLSEALGILQRATLVLTEDCGLMHMAWTSGVPTLALFGSSRHDQAAPIGTHVGCLHSGDLPCGACMDSTCRFGDVHCLTRFEPRFVVSEAERLLARLLRGERTCYPLAM